MSIILMIIGFLVVGLLGVGRIIKNVKLIKVVGEIVEINTAYKVFVQVYDALPGDFKDAEMFFGNVGVKSGDGDRQIEIIVGVLGSDLTGDESSNVFYHFSLSEILPGDYSVRIDEASYAYDSGIGAKAVIVNEIDGAGAKHGGFSSHLAGKNVLLFGKVLLTTTRVIKDPGVHSAFLMPQDAYKIDKKLDDGLPSNGRVSYRAESGSATSGDVTASGCGNGSTYQLTETEETCNLVYELEY